MSAASATRAFKAYLAYISCQKLAFGEVNFLQAVYAERQTAVPTGEPVRDCSNPAVLGAWLTDPIMGMPELEILPSIALGGR